MKRPGPVGVTIVLAFVIVAVIELRTLLGMFGVNVATQTYYGLATLVVALVMAALFALPKKESSHANKA